MAMPTGYECGEGEEEAPGVGTATGSGERGQGGMPGYGMVGMAAGSRGVQSLMHRRPASSVPQRTCVCGMGSAARWQLVGW